MEYVSRVLVVANVTSASDDLIDALRARVDRSPARFHLLMPATDRGIAAREALQPRLDQTLDRWREAGLEADGEIGDRDPTVAVSEAWDPRAYDEVIVSTLPGHASKWMQFDLPHRVARITDSLVTHVVAREPGAVQPTLHSVSELKRADPGLLSVLAWGDWKHSR
jgi:GABA permease